MKMSDIGRSALEAREGLRLAAYKDSVGVWTVGFGHTAACGAPIPRAGLKITPAEADACLARDLDKFERAIAGALKVPVADHEFDALVSIAFNAGPDFANSTAVRKLNAGDRSGAAKAIMMWSKPASIIDRREGERDQFLTPYAKALPKARRSDAHPVKAAPGIKPDKNPVFMPEKSAAAAAPRVILPPLPPDVPVPAPVAAPQPPQGGFFARVAALFRKA